MFNFLFNILKKKKKEPDKPNEIQTACELNEEELFRDNPNEKAKIEAWWLQKGVEEAVEEDYEPEPEASDKDDELMGDSDDLIHNLKEEGDDDDDIDLVIKEALDALGESTSEELLEIGKEILLKLNENIPIKEEAVTK